MSSSDSLNAARTFLISPGAGMSISERILPVDPPSSATVTTAEISIGYFFSPRARTLSPVPPPIKTTFILVFLFMI